MLQVHCLNDERTQQKNIVRMLNQPFTNDTINHTIDNVIRHGIFLVYLIELKNKGCGYPSMTTHQYMHIKIEYNKQRYSSFIVVIHLKVRARPSTRSIKKSLRRPQHQLFWNSLQKKIKIIVIFIECNTI